MFIEYIDHLFDARVDRSDPIAKVVLFLGVYCSVILNVGRRHSDFIIRSLSHLVSLTLLRCRNGTLNPLDQNLIDQIPTSIEGALQRFNLGTKSLVTFAICENCDYTHPPTFKLGSDRPIYPRICGAVEASRECTQELTHLQPGSNDMYIPRKIYKYYPLREYVAGLLSRPDIESILDLPLDETLASLEKPRSEMRNGFFDGDFVRAFLGPDGKTLFIDRSGETRLFFSLNVDWFNVNMVLARGANSSTGILAMACLNLPVNIRYKSENMYLAAVIPGPNEPSLTRMNHYLRPLMEEMEIFWKTGVEFSRTALSPTGKLVRCALAICVCDLPAARKVSGFAGHGANHYCTVCTGYGRTETLGLTNVEDWELKDIVLLKQNAELWRDALSEATRTKIFSEFGLRWSVIWRSGHWDPTKQLVPDPMHCLLENLASNHFRDYLSLTLSAASEKAIIPPAFYFYFQMYHPNAVPCLPSKTARPKATTMELENRIRKIFDSANSAALFEKPEHLITQLKTFRVADLQAVCNSLKVDPIRDKKASGAFLKADYSRGLIQWVCC